MMRSFCGENLLPPLGGYQISILLRNFFYFVLFFFIFFISSFLYAAKGYDTINKESWVWLVT